MVCKGTIHDKVYEQRVYNATPFLKACATRSEQTFSTTHYQAIFQRLLSIVWIGSGYGRVFWALLASNASFRWPIELARR